MSDELNAMEKPRGTRIVVDGLMVIVEFVATSYPVASGVARCGMIESGERRLISNLSGSEIHEIRDDSYGFHRTGLLDVEPGVTLNSKFSDARTVNWKVGNWT